MRKVKLVEKEENAWWVMKRVVRTCMEGQLVVSHIDPEQQTIND